MTVQLISSYLVALVGLAVGVVAGWIVVGVARRSIPSERLTGWDAWATMPLLMGAAGAHLALISQVETQRKVMFSLYVAALVGVVIVGLAGAGIWRLGAILFPAGSIAAYFYFAMAGHQVDYVGLLVKLVELATIVTALVGLRLRVRGYGVPSIVT